jgi:transcriptional regulator with XRE-family HTH domain
MNRFGRKIRELREKEGLLLRQVAANLETDTAHISKLERGERKAKKEQVIRIAQILNANSNELLTLWLSDQIYEVVKNEKNAIQALDIVKNEIIDKNI